MTESEIQNMIL